MSDEITDHLRGALDRVDAFRAIHEPGGVTLEAVLNLQEAVGIDDESRRLIGERIYSETAEGQDSATFLGVIIGLLAAQLASEREAV